MAQLLRRPTSEHTVWLHIDRLDREDGRIWAVQWLSRRGRPMYRAVHQVGVFMEGHTIRFGGPTTTRQPRAVIVFRDAAVKVIRTGQFWAAVIDRRS